jgi:hypothetical protein
MGRSKKTELPVSGRAGMSIARAERLVARTQTRGSKSSQAFVALGLAAVAGMTAYGVISGSTQQRGEDVMVFAAAEAGSAASTVAPSVELTADAKPAVQSSAPVVESAQANAPAASVASTEVVTLAAETGTTAAASTAQSDTASAGCVDTIEGLLVSMQSAATQDGSWASQQEGLTQLVQTTLDCESAGFRVAGSLELVGSGLADLKVHWDREGKVLDLAMIDRTNAPTADVAPASDDSSIEFVIR